MSLLVIEKMLVSNFGIQAENVLKASNGLEAYELSVYNEVDLVLMDLNMPIMDGF
jgi:YesN/AraC family two-component response regulator